MLRLIDISIALLMTMLSYPVVQSLFVPRIKEKVLRHRIIAPCANISAPVRILPNIVTVDRGRTLFSAQIELVRPVKEISKLTLKVKRCLSYSDVESCEFFYNFKFLNICQMMKMKNKPWYPVIQTITPADYRQCPFKKGMCRMTNVTIDPDAISTLFPGVEGYYWIVQADAYESGQHLGCMIYGGEVTTIKSKL